MAAATPNLESATRGAKSSAALEFLKSSPKKLLINGKWVPSKSGKTFETLNPANEQVLALVAEGDKADVDEAVKHARKAYEDGEWANLSPHARTRFLLKIADLIEQRAQRIGRIGQVLRGEIGARILFGGVHCVAGGKRFLGGGQFSGRILQRQQVLPNARG